MTNVGFSPFGGSGFHCGHFGHFIFRFSSSCQNLKVTNSNLGFKVPYTEDSWSSITLHSASNLDFHFHQTITSKCK